MSVVPPKIYGVRRALRALLFSWQGMKAAFKSEEAFRIEVYLAIVFLPLGLYLGRTGIERVLLMAPVFIVLIVELINTAIEALVDRISPEYHDLSKKAKDIGSSIVFLSLVLFAATWALVLCCR